MALIVRELSMVPCRNAHFFLSRRCEAELTHAKEDGIAGMHRNKENINPVQIINFGLTTKNWASLPLCSIKPSF